MSRSDTSPNLIHFTSGANWEEASRRIYSMVKEGQIRGSNGFIRGEFNCICFSEAPVHMLPNGLVNPNAYSRYSPFGIMVTKQWLFSQGGRPVFYQPPDEYFLLPEQLRWRYVRYEPCSEQIIDFTWEREWRIRCDYLNINPSIATIVTPSRDWAEYIMSMHNEEQDWNVYQYAMCVDETIAELVREPFQWTVLTLQ